MTPHNSDDAITENLKQLAVLSPDPNRTEHARARCHTRFDRSRRRERRFAVIGGFAWGVLGPAVLGAFSIFYTAALIDTTLRLRAVFF